MPDSCLRLGVGIHTGNVLVGCIGSTMKMKPLNSISLIDLLNPFKSYYVMLLTVDLLNPII